MPISRQATTTFQNTSQRSSAVEEEFFFFFYYYCALPSCDCTVSATYRADWTCPSTVSVFPTSMPVSLVENGAIFGIRERNSKWTHSFTGEKVSGGVNSCLVGSLDLGTHTATFFWLQLLVFPSSTVFSTKVTFVRLVRGRIARIEM